MRMVMWMALMAVILFGGCETGPSFMERHEAEKLEREQADRDKVRNSEIREFKDFLALQEYINSFGVWNRDELEELLDARRRQWYVDNRPQLLDRVRDCIRDGKIRMGMAAEEVQASWGWPQEVNRTVHQYGTSSQWVYRPPYNPYISYKSRYLYFENGILRSWQD